MIYYETNYLAHHGILGMKWGVRRYQNKDGSLTSEGRRRQAMDKKSKELSEKAEKVGMRSQAAKELKKMHDDWRKKNPNADEDDYGDYLANHPALEDKYYRLHEKVSRSKSGKKAYDLRAKSQTVKSNYVKQQTMGTALGSSLLAAPIAMFTVNKALKLFGVDGKKRAIAALATGFGTTSALTIAAYTKSKSEHEGALEEYGLDKDSWNKKQH